MKTINRIYQYIDYKGITSAEFERINSISNGYLSKMKNRSASIGEDIMVIILENCPEIEPKWLLTGEGPMLKSAASDVSKNNVKTTLPIPDDNGLLSVVISQQRTIEKLCDIIADLEKRDTAREDGNASCADVG